MSLLRRTFRQLCLILTPLVLVATFMVGSGASRVGASSHREAPLISKDPSVDNTDVYAFVSPDAPTTVTLISNWIPFEEPSGGPNFYHFDDNARYLIKIDRDGDAIEDITYEWTFRTHFRNRNTFLYNTFPVTSTNSPNLNYTQYYTVTEKVGNSAPVVLFGNVLMVPDHVGPRSNPNYEALAAAHVRSGTGAAAGIKEFTGQRDDPFFVDVGSIFDLGGLRPFNAAHILKLPTAPGIDSLTGYSIHTTALQVPKSRLAPNCDGTQADTDCVIGVWSTAERPVITTRSAGAEVGSGGFIQVSRLGHPLVNEVVMDLGLKDIFNAVPPSVDRTVPAVVNKVTNPELATLINVLYQGVVAPVSTSNRQDLVTVFLTGIPGVTQQANSATTPSEQLRLNIAIAPSNKGVCGGDRLGAMNGDVAGYPNGRRLEDDVTDIAIRAVAEGYGSFLNTNFGLPNKSPNNVLGDGVDRDNKPCLPNFPYMATPDSGYSRIHAALFQSYMPVISRTPTVYRR